MQTFPSNYPELLHIKSLNQYCLPCWYNNSLQICWPYLQNRPPFQTYTQSLELQEELFLILETKFRHNLSILIHAKVIAYYEFNLWSSCSILLCSTNRFTLFPIDSYYEFGHDCFSHTFRACKTILSFYQLALSLCSILNSLNQVRSYHRLFCLRW